MYSQANVREESALRPPTRALPSVIVDTEKVLREADGSVELVMVIQVCQIRLQDLTHQPPGHFQDRGVIAQHLLPARLHHLQ